MKRFLSILLALLTVYSAVSADETISLSTSTVMPSAVVQSTVQVHGDYVYGKPHLFSWLKYQVDDQKQFWKFTFNKQSLLPLAVVAASTALLISYDEYLYNNSWKLGDKWSISHQGVQRSFFKTR